MSGLETGQRRRVQWGLLLLAVWLTGCGKPEPTVPPPTEADPLAAVAPERRFKGLLGGKPVHLAVHACKVFRALPGEGGWQMVLEPDPYPFFTACERQTLHAEDGAVTVTLGRIAFGAGGCCATGGTYRSTDGERWKKL
jgi:hypothetical protein